MSSTNTVGVKAYAILNESHGTDSIDAKCCWVQKMTAEHWQLGVQGNCQQIDHW